MKGFDASNVTHEDSVTVSFKEYIAENIQACLCHDLISRGAQLIPTVTSDTTLHIEGLPANIVITNTGRDARIAIQHHEDRLPTAEQRMKMYTRVLGTYPYVATKSGSRLHYEVTGVPSDFEKDYFIAELKDRQQKSLCK